MALAALLSHMIGVEVDGKRPMPSSSCRIQRASLLASKAAMYSASQDDTATVFCLRALQEVTPEPRLNV